MEKSTVRRKWKIEEELVLLKEIKRHPELLNYAFFNTARLVKRTPDACRIHWYKELRHKTTEPIYALVSEKKACVNTKVDRFKKYEGIKLGKGVWSRIKEIFSK